MSDISFVIDKIEYTVYNVESNVNATVTGGKAGLTDAIIHPTVTNGGITYNVTSIGNFAFDHRGSLTSVIIPSSITTIGEQAFSRTGLIRVTIPNSVTTIGKYAFIYTSNLIEIDILDGNLVYSSLDGVLYNYPQTTLICYPEAKQTIDGHFTIPDSVTTIDDSAFAYCDLSTVTIPNGMKSIGYGAFHYSQSLTSVNIPNSVTTIGDLAFAYCRRLTSVNIPDGVASIGYQTFIQCNLTSVNIPDSVKSIGYGAFAACNSLNNVIIGNNVTSIDTSAFEHCTNLASVKFFGDAPLNIGDNVFLYDNNLIVYYLSGRNGFDTEYWQALHATPFYMVTYNANGGTGQVPIDSNTYLEGNDVTVLGNTGSLAKTGYIFDGWNTKADGMGIDYVAGNTFTIGAANTTLYAKWVVLPPPSRGFNFF